MDNYTPFCSNYKSGKINIRIKTLYLHVYLLTLNL